MKINEYRIIKAEGDGPCFVYSPSFRFHHSAGFTLIELIVVLMIIGISLGLTGIFFSKGSSNLELKKFAREIATTLKYARNRAVSEKKVYSFIIRNSDGAYSLYGADIAEYGEDDTLQSVMSKSVPKNLSIRFDERGEDAIKIKFFPVGNSTGGVIDIRNQADRSFLVTVNRVTGKVEISKNQSSY